MIREHERPFGAVPSTYQTTNEREKMTNDTNWLKHYYSGAIGFKIVGATISPDGFPQLVCQKGRGKDREEIVIEVSQDEEGNRAGFLFGLPIPDTKSKGCE